MNENPTMPSESRDSPLPCEKELLEECEALILYVARHGDILKQDNQEDEKAAFAAYDGLVAAVNSKDDWEGLRKNYARVTALTQEANGVSGRSVFDTLSFGTAIKDQKGLGRGQKALCYLCRLNPFSFSHGPRRPMAVGLFFFGLALLLQAVLGWAGRVSDPSKLGSLIGWYWIVKDLAPLLLAGLWGGIGSCIFLMKKLTDRLSAMTYEQSRQKGDLARIFVGAFLGMAAVEIALGEASGEAMMVGQVSLAPNLVALAAGLATKTVYGLLEALIEGIAERVSPKHKDKGES